MIISRIAFSLFFILLVCSCVEFKEYDQFESAIPEETKIIGFDVDQKLADLAKAFDTPDLRHFSFDMHSLRRYPPGVLLYIAGDVQDGSINILFKAKNGRLQELSHGRPTENWDPIPPPDPDRLKAAIKAILGEWPEGLEYEGECQDKSRTRCFRWRRIVHGYPVERDGVYALLACDGSLKRLYVPWAKILGEGNIQISKQRAKIIGRIALEWIRVRWFLELWPGNIFRQINMKLVHVKPNWGINDRELFSNYSGVRRLAWVIEYERDEPKLGGVTSGYVDSIRLRVHIDAETGAVIGFDDNLGIFWPWVPLT